MKRTLTFNSRFLDNHMLGELEQKIWNFIDRNFETHQGFLEEDKIKVKLVVEQE